MNNLQKEFLRIYGEEKYYRIRATRIGIAGAGGLGSNCAFNLVRAGFENFTIVDFDTVAHSNLNRQFYFYRQAESGIQKVHALRQNLLEINPALHIDAHCVRLTAQNARDIFRDCAAVVEAFDGAADKAMLCETLAGSGQLLVCASGIAGYGDSDAVVTRKISDGLYVVGDMRSDVADMPPLSPRVNIVAAKQADVILTHVLESAKVKM